MNLIELQKRKRYRETKNPRNILIPAKLGRADGTLYASQKFYVYARLNDGIEITVLNVRVPSAYDRSVLLGYDGNLNELQVITVQATDDDEKQGIVADHHENHEWPNPDTVWVRGQQIMPGLLVPVTGWVLRWYEQYVRTDAGLIRVLTQDIDVSSYVPENGACWLLIGYDNTGATNIHAGETVDAIELLNDENMPAYPSGIFVRWAVKLCGFFTEPRHGGKYDDLVDLRWSGTIPFASGSIITTDHNNLPGLQGGTADEYYHLTENQHTEASSFLNGGTSSHTEIDEAIEALRALSFLDLADTPNSYAGKADYVVAVNGAEDGLILVETTGSGGGNPLFFVDGRLVATTNPGGAYICTTDLEIDLVYIHCSQTGSSGSTIIDVNLNGNTIFATQANRPELAYNDVDHVAVSGIPDTIVCAAGDVLTIDIDQVAVGAAILSVVIAFIGGGSGGRAPIDAEYWVESSNALLSNAVVVGSKGITSVGFSSRQAAEKAGRLFLPSDGLHIWRDTGTVWQPWGPIFPMEPPVLDDFTWVNQGTSTATEERGAITLVPPLDYQQHMLVKSPPSTPYTITAGFLFGGFANANFLGLCWRNSSTGQIQAFYMLMRNVAALNRAAWSSNSAVAGDQYIVYPPGALFWLRIHDDGTNITMSWSSDGYNFSVYEVLDRTNYLTTYDQIGVCFSAFNNQFQPRHTWLHWSQS